jgi:hypothetical protein
MYMYFSYHVILHFLANLKPILPSVLDAGSDNNNTICPPKLTVRKAVANATLWAANLQRSNYTVLFVFSL